jgi:zinc protease
MNSRLLSVVAALAGVFSISFAVFAQEVRLPEGMKFVTAAEGITEYELANGLRALVFPDDSRPIVTVNMTYKVGSRHEGYGETGMAHLLEHLVFKGTPRHPNIPKELTERGARANGTTWFDRTNYYETVDDTEENIRWALDLEADRMVNSFIARKDLETEFSVVRNEFESGENSPSGVLSKRMLAAAFQWHNYGHSTIGEKSDIEGAPIERLQAFYRNYYQPDNAALVLVGRFTEQKAVDWIHEYFSKIPKPTRTIIPTYTREPTQDGERQVTLRRVGEVQVVAAQYHSAPAAHVDQGALAVLADILRDDPSGRLYKALVETKKAVSVSGYQLGLMEAGMISFSATLRPDQSLEDAKTVLLNIVEQLKDNPITQEEMDKARARLLKNLEMSFKQSDSLGLTLSTYIGAGDWRLVFWQRDNLEKVTLADVQRVATHYLKPANRTLGLFIPDAKPDRAEIPKAPDLAVLFKDYKGKPAMAKGENFEPTPENIEARTRRGKFDNGMQYAFLPRKTRGAAVAATLTLRFGTLESTKGQSVVSDFTGSMLDTGTAKKTRQQIQDAFDALKARVNVYGGGQTAGASIDTDREHFNEVVKLVAEILKEPSFPENEFDKIKRQRLAALERDQSQPDALGGRLFNRLSRPEYAKDDPRYTMTFEEEMEAVKAVTLEQVKAFYKNFYGASHATVAIVGDFDEAAVTALLKEEFGAWKNPGEYVRIATDYAPVPARNEMIVTPDKANAFYLAGFGFPMKDVDPEYPALTISGYMLGGGFLNSRLATRIRQKEGLSYGVGGSFRADAQDNDGGFSARAIYNPDNLPKLETAFREEIEKAASEGFTAAELDAAKTGWLKAQKVGRSSDRALANTLNNYLTLGRDFSFNAQREKNVENLTLEQVNAATKKQLDFSKMIIVKSGNFKQGLQ